MLTRLENWLAQLYKGSPQLSSEAKKSIINIWPWVALVFGSLQLLAAFGLWHTGHILNNAVNNFNRNYGSSLGTVSHLNAFYWLSLIVLLLDAVLLLAAFPKLRAAQKGGWNLLFYGALLNIFYGIASAFNDYGGVSSLIVQIVVTVVILYFLFQIRNHYQSNKK